MSDPLLVDLLRDFDALPFLEEFSCSFKLDSHFSISTCLEIYTWSTLDGINKEVDGLMLLALILDRIFPNFKVDMYIEIGKVKKLTIAQHDNGVQLFFDAAKYMKLQIDQKDPTAYTEDAFIWDIFL
jgi:hypothetical protein